MLFPFIGSRKKNKLAKRRPYVVSECSVSDENNEAGSVSVASDAGSLRSLSKGSLSTVTTQDNEDSDEASEKRPTKTKFKNVRGESVIVENRNTKESKVSKKSRHANSSSIGSVRKAAKRRPRSKPKSLKKMGSTEASTMGSNNDMLTDYSFIIDNYINDPAVPVPKNADRRSEYSILLKNKLCEYLNTCKRASPQ